VTLTLAQVRTQVRTVDSDTVAWPNASIDAWIAQGIRFYSAQFPRRWRHTQTLTTGTQSYALPGGHGFRGMVSVEYPAGQSPARYLARVANWSERFRAGGRCYALIGVSDTTAPESDSSAGAVKFAETVTTGESAVFEYLGDHVAPVAGDDDAVITVPAAHLEAITAYVSFAGRAELATDEAVNVTESALILSQLGQESRLAWNRYKEVMDRLGWLGVERGGEQPTWAEIGL
jgi:hypothetical protein